MGMCRDGRIENMTTENKILYQGEPGANSHIACKESHPDMEPTACRTFADCFEKLKAGEGALALIPIENSVAGRVADIHHLMPNSGVFIVGEHFSRIRHQLLGLDGAPLEDIKTVRSHAMALGQCRKVITELGLSAVASADTAGAAREIKEAADASQAAIASELAADIYGLNILKQNIEDEKHNTTRFLVLSRERSDAELGETDVMTSFVFRVRNVPAALYKAMGGFATNNVNMTKLESYQVGGSFQATQFYADIEGHPEDVSVKLAMEELDFYTTEMTILGCYKASDFRQKTGE